MSILNYFKSNLSDFHNWVGLSYSGEVTTQPNPWVAKWVGYKTKNLAQPYPLHGLV